MKPQDDLELQNLYELSKQQLSDLVFLDDEIKFLKSLLFKHFMPMMHDKQINRVQLINTHLSQLGLLKANVSEELLSLQGHLRSNINGLVSQSIDFIKLGNERIEYELRDLNRSFRNIKKEIFALYKELPCEEAEKKSA
jgi:hypothetical protein